MEYFKEEYYTRAKKQRAKNLIIYFSVTFVFLVISVGLILWYRTLPYRSATVNTIKWIHYPIVGLFIIFSCIFFTIPFKRVNKFCKHCKNVLEGKREETVATYIENDDTLKQKDGVDCKSLIFLEWNKIKKDYFERSVLVFNELPFPEIEPNTDVRFITQGNFLVSYEYAPEGDGYVEENNDNLSQEEREIMEKKPSRKSPETQRDNRVKVEGSKKSEPPKRRERNVNDIFK